MKYTKRIFDHYFKLIFQKCGINDSDCFSEIQLATKEMIDKVEELENRIEQLEKK